jgi:hypothetical protein
MHLTLRARIVLVLAVLCVVSLAGFPSPWPIVVGSLSYLALLLPTIPPGVGHVALVPTPLWIWRLWIAALSIGLLATGVERIYSGHRPFGTVIVLGSLGSLAGVVLVAPRKQRLRDGALSPERTPEQPPARTHLVPVDDPDD